MTEFDRRKLCFDSILVRAAGSNYNPMSIEAFLALHFDERIALIMGRRVRFFEGEKEVAVYDAVKSISDARG
jgi:hypothetical protein